jgi:hypothetical protein
MMQRTLVVQEAWTDKRLKWRKKEFLRRKRKGVIFGLLCSGTIV